MYAFFFQNPFLLSLSQFSFLLFLVIIFCHIYTAKKVVDVWRHVSYIFIKLVLNTFFYFKPMKFQQFSNQRMSRYSEGFHIWEKNWYFDLLETGRHLLNNEHLQGPAKIYM